MIFNSVRDLLPHSPIHSVPHDATVAQACALLEMHDVGALGVTQQIDATDALVGIISARDVVRACNAQGCDIAQTRVAQIMTRNVQVAYVDDSLTDALATMTEGRFRHLPVVNDEGLPVAMLSIHDVPTDYQRMFDGFQDDLTPAQVQAH